MATVLLYSAVCLGVQLLLSRPLLMRPLRLVNRLLTRLRDGLLALQLRGRFAALQLARRAGLTRDKRPPSDAAAV